MQREYVWWPWAVTPSLSSSACMKRAPASSSGLSQNITSSRTASCRATSYRSGQQVNMKKAPARSSGLSQNITSSRTASCRDNDLLQVRSTGQHEEGPGQQLRALTEHHVLTDSLLPRQRPLTGQVNRST